MCFSKKSVYKKGRKRTILETQLIVYSLWLFVAVILALLFVYCDLLFKTLIYPDQYNPEANFTWALIFINWTFLRDLQRKVSNFYFHFEAKKSEMPVEISKLEEKLLSGNEARNFQIVSIRLYPMQWRS